jgi:translation initiation factor 2A
MEFTAVSKDGVHIFSYLPGEEMPDEPDISFPAVPTSEGCVWSSDGMCLGLVNQRTGGVAVYNAAASYEKLSELPPLMEGSLVRMFYFSPLGNYVVTYERWFKDAGDNVAVWNARTGEFRWSFTLKTLTEMNWPPLKWTALETHCCRMVSDGVQILKGSVERDEPLGKIDLPRIMAFEVAPKGSGSGAPHVSVVTPELKGAPASCLIYSLEDPSSVRSRKSFYKVQKVTMKWNHTGTAVLVLTQMETDDTGKAYYGSTNLYFLRADGQEDATVSAAGDGAVHDVEWCPIQDEFLLLAGDLPCRMNLFDGKKANQKMEFGSGHRNTVRFNPFGRFVALGGFGQLAGDTDFWDKAGRKKLGSVRMECCVVSGWGPDGRHFLAATTAPRMRVDNKIEIYDYCANRLGSMPFEELLWAGWRPRPRGAFQDRPPTPGRQGPSSSGTAGPKSKATAKPQAYRPPNARGVGSGGGLSALLRQELGSTSAESNSTATKVFGGRILGALPPGAAPPGEGDQGDKNSRNARRKKATEAKKAVAEAEQKEKLAAALAPTTAAKAQVEFSPPSRKSEPEPSTSPSTTGGTASIDHPEVEKKARAIRKKLRDIEKLKEKPAKDLDTLQKEKIKGEADLWKQLKDLGYDE